VSVSKSTNRVRNFIVRQLRLLAAPVALAVAMAAVFAFLLSGYITRTVAGLASKADRIASGEQGVKLETWSKSELGELARSVERMRRKLEGKAYVEEMVTTLSHELKTPLASIRGAAEVLEDGAIRDDEARAKFLGNIQSEVQRLDRIVSELLKLSRIETQPEPLPATPTDAAAVVRELEKIYRDRAGNLAIAFSCASPQEPLAIRLSDVQLRQVLVNLLDNALAFTPSGGEIALVLARGDGIVEFRVRDTGAGIEPELLPKIFDRFFTTENPRTGNRGTGLGLAIVKTIVEQNRGTVRVTSERGKGTEFIVTLPVA
jgi:signal transduction histidine kinase